MVPGSVQIGSCMGWRLPFGKGGNYPSVDLPGQTGRRIAIRSCYDMEIMGFEPPYSGGCQCGSVRYEIRGKLIDYYACHCTECRKQSASAFGMSIIVREDDFGITRGITKIWNRPSDFGGTADCHFCPECGVRIWHSFSNDPDFLSVKGGTLDQPPDYSQAYHIWTRSALPGFVFPDNAKRHPRQPDFAR